MQEEIKWQAVKNMLASGMKPTEIAKCGLFNITAKEIYAKKKLWDKQAYRVDPKYQDPKYKKWRLAVLTRDKHRCIICKRGRKEVRVLQVDHIKSWSRYPEFRFNVANGRTLCVYHHKRTLNYGRKANTCDDSLNGRTWELKERLLWKKKLEASKKRKPQSPK